MKNQISLPQATPQRGATKLLPTVLTLDTNSRWTWLIAGSMCLASLGLASRVHAQEPVPVATATATAAASSGDVIADHLPKVVKIFGAGGYSKLKGYCSGFLISPDGYIATVSSHVLDAREVTVVLHDGRRLPGKFVGLEPEYDLALLKIDVTAAPYVDLQQAQRPGVGTRVLAFSNMFKVATGNEPVSVIRGVVSAITPLDARRGTYRIPFRRDVLIVDAVTNNSGSAGGLLVSVAGAPVGMIGKELRDRRNHVWINYSIPLVDLLPAIEAIRTGGSLPRKSLDEPLLLEANYVPEDFGLTLVPAVIPRTPPFVDRVAGGSPADRAGLAPDDLVILANDELVSSSRVLTDLLARLQAGDVLRLTVRRGDSLISVDLPVEVKP